MALRKLRFLMIADKSRPHPSAGSIPSHCRILSELLPWNEADADDDPPQVGQTVARPQGDCKPKALAGSWFNENTKAEHQAAALTTIVF
jgi:hypothetical protein